MALFSCNYNTKDLNINSQFYLELLEWWSQFREDNAVDNRWQYIIWNNQEIRINNKPVFYKKYFHYGIQTTRDLRFDLNNIDSYKLVEKHLEKTNFLEWTGLRHSIPPNLRNPNLDYVYPFQFQNPSFNLVNDLFDVTKRKSKDYYSLLVLKKARLPNLAQKLKNDLNLSDEALKNAFLLPHSATFEPYTCKGFSVQSVEFHTIPYNSFCKQESETLQHFFYDCSHSSSFWKDFESYYLSRQVNKYILIGKKF